MSLLVAWSAINVGLEVKSNLGNILELEMFTSNCAVQTKFL